MERDTQRQAPGLRLIHHAAVPIENAMGRGKVCFTAYLQHVRDDILPVEHQLSHAVPVHEEFERILGTVRTEDVHYFGLEDEMNRLPSFWLVR